MLRPTILLFAAAASPAERLLLEVVLILFLLLLAAFALRLSEASLASSASLLQVDQSDLLLLLFLPLVARAPVAKQVLAHSASLASALTKATARLDG